MILLQGCSVEKRSVLKNAWRKKELEYLLLFTSPLFFFFYLLSLEALLPLRSTRRPSVERWGHALKQFRFDLRRVEIAFPRKHNARISFCARTHDGTHKACFVDLLEVFMVNNHVGCLAGRGDEFHWKIRWSENWRFRIDLLFFFSFSNTFF